MRFWTATALLTVLLFLLWLLDPYGLGLNEAALQQPWWSLLAALSTASAIGWAVVRADAANRHLVGAVFLVHFGIAYLMTAVEGVYLTELRGILAPLLVNGLITAGLFAPPAVLVHRAVETTTSERLAPSVIRSRSLLWKLPLLALLWTLLFVLAGALVFLPVARAVAPDLLAGYADLPPWVLPFQAGRAILWLLLALPLLRLLRGGRIGRALTLGVLFATLMGSQLLSPNPLLPEELRLAHLLEVVLANFALGFAAGWLLPSSTRDPFPQADAAGPATKRSPRAEAPVRRTG